MLAGLLCNWERRGATYLGTGGGPMGTPFKPRAPPMDGERDLAVGHAESTVVHPALWLAVGGGVETGRIKPRAGEVLGSPDVRAMEGDLQCDLPASHCREDQAGSLQATSPGRNRLSWPGVGTSVPTYLGRYLRPTGEGALLVHH